MKKLTVLATLGLIAFVSVGVLLLSLGTVGTAHAGPVPCVSQTGGSIDSDIILPDGSGVCDLTNVTVNGNIRIFGKTATRLRLHGSVVNGSIQSNGGGLNVDTGSTVNGNINVKHCGSSIKLEDSTINGNVRLISNGTVVVERNTIDGNLTLLKNGDATAVGDNDVSGTTTIKP